MKNIKLTCILEHCWWLVSSVDGCWRTHLEESRPGNRRANMHSCRSWGRRGGRGEGKEEWGGDNSSLANIDKKAARRGIHAQRRWETQRREGREEVLEAEQEERWDDSRTTPVATGCCIPGGVWVCGVCVARGGRGLFLSVLVLICWRCALCVCCVALKKGKEKGSVNVACTCASCMFQKMCVSVCVYAKLCVSICIAMAACSYTYGTCN